MDELRALAERTIKGGTCCTLAGNAEELARGVIAFLGVAFPCGFAEPVVIGPDEVLLVPEDACPVDADSAHGIGLAYIRAAERARSAMEDAVAEHEERMRTLASPVPSGMEPES